MCGIVGMAGRHEPSWVERMNAAIEHRGPDDRGIYQSSDRSVTLAMRRLSILDLSGGHQPMSNHDATIWIVYNGEVFNSPELRQRLEREGCRFKTANSDTEVILQLYETKGDAFVSELNGMFAFVIHDQRRNRLFGARDRLGIKPLHYCQRDGRLAWASELKALLSLPWMERRPDPQSLYHYMTLGYVPGEASIWDGIERLPPGHSFTYDLARGELSIQRFWDLSLEPVEGRSEDECAERLRHELRAAVRRWSLSDVPLACSLSGGIDSAALVGLLAEQGYPQVKTYSLGFTGDGEASWNETPLARQAAERWGTDHHEIVLDPKSLLDDLLAMVWALDEPYGGGLPSWYVFREIAKDVKVAFTGTGGDELFGNYGRFQRYETDRLLGAAVAFRRAFPAAATVFGDLAAPVVYPTEFVPAGVRWFGRRRLLSRAPSLLRQPFGEHYANCEWVPDRTKRSFFSMDTATLDDTAQYIQRVFDSFSAPDIRTGLAAVECRTLLADEYLLMTDRFSMAFSLEARVPFLDHELVEFVFRLPSSMRTRFSDPKHLLKRAVGDLLPPDLLTAPKRGFVIPIELWLRRELRPLAERLLAPDRLRRQGIFNPNFYHAVVEPHVTGRANNSRPLWSALMYQLWHELFVEQRVTEAPSFTWRDLC